ncbi:uncharacterized protein DNG_00392 [Cephalotrichum gorgonifer]|uniref:Uncharacterized protein n=1 Tax=Cephalotrichum gorgonifer TaxID=2041049 RepID=A0AAE8SR68_9PEZI|nr:uncharacterized protein DNG_00392 [Cephalotrichum gorgonifer]
MPFWDIFTHQASKDPSKRKPTASPVLLTPPESPRPYSTTPRRYRRAPFRPKHQAEPQTLSWVSSPNQSALDAILRKRDTGDYFVATTQRTHAAAETKTWMRAPTEENLRRDLRQRDRVGGATSRAPLPRAPELPPLGEMVKGAGVDVGSSDGEGGVKKVDVRGCGGESCKGGEWAQGGVVPELPPPPAVHHRFAKGNEERDGGGEGMVRVVTRVGDGFRTSYVPGRPPKRAVPPSYSRLMPLQGRGNEGKQAREARRRDAASRLPPRPSCVPSNFYADITSPSPSPSDSEADRGGAADGEIVIGVEVGVERGATARGRRNAVSPPCEPETDSVPEEYLTWSIASLATFSNSNPSTSGDDADEREYDGDNSSSSSDESGWGEEYHLKHIRHALSLPPTISRHSIEAWLLRNPSALYHLSRLTVPNPGLAAQHGSRLRLASGAEAAMAGADLESHIRAVEWGRLDLDRMGRTGRVAKGGGKAARKTGAGGPRKVTDIEGIAEYLHGVRTRGIVPSGLRFCEMAE